MAFDLKISERCVRYTPDFYLPDMDLWLEVKGLYWNKSMAKYNEFSKHFRSCLLDESTIACLVGGKVCKFYNKWKDRSIDFAKTTIKENIICFRDLLLQ